jgi:hypothetical protein
MRVAEEARLAMVRIFILLSIYVVMVTLLVFLLTTGLLRPVPWAPIFFMLMLAFGVIVLRARGTDRVNIEPAMPRFLWTKRIYLVWALASFTGAFYEFLMWMWNGDRGDLGAAIGVGVWTLILVYVLRIMYRKKDDSGLRGPPSDN